MNYEPIPWMSNREICVADYHLIEYLEHQHTNLRLFLMGPGYEHLIGKDAWINEDRIVALTHSPGEMCSYMAWAIDNPWHSTYYQCMFGDIHLIDRSILGDFGIAALLHLGERYTTGARATEEVIKMFDTSQALVFYTGSFGWSELLPVVTRTGRKFIEQYKSLAIYQ